MFGLFHSVAPPVLAFRDILSAMARDIAMMAVMRIALLEIVQKVYLRYVT